MPSGPPPWRQRFLLRGMDLIRGGQMKSRDLSLHVGWLRRLGLHLARNQMDAEDLAQDACVAALQRPPRDDGRPIRSWLAVVLGNFSRMRRRHDRRRARLEEAFGNLPRQESNPPEVAIHRLQIARDLAV